MCIDRKDELSEARCDNLIYNANDDIEFKQFEELWSQPLKSVIQKFLQAEKNQQKYYLNHQSLLLRICYLLPKEVEEILAEFELIKTKSTNTISSSEWIFLASEAYVIKNYDHKLSSENKPTKNFDPIYCYQQAKKLNDTLSAYLIATTLYGGAEMGFKDIDIYIKPNVYTSFFDLDLSMELSKDEKRLKSRLKDFIKNSPLEKLKKYDEAINQLRQAAEHEKIPAAAFFLIRMIQYWEWKIDKKGPLTRRSGDKELTPDERVRKIYGDIKYYFILGYNHGEVRTLVSKNFFSRRRCYYSEHKGLEIKELCKNNKLKALKYGLPNALFSLALIEANPSKAFFYLKYLVSNFYLQRQQKKESCSDGKLKVFNKLINKLNVFLDYNFFNKQVRGFESQLYIMEQKKSQISTTNKKNIIQSFDQNTHKEYTRGLFTLLHNLYEENIIYSNQHLLLYLIYANYISLKKTYSKKLCEFYNTSAVVSHGLYTLILFITHYKTWNHYSSDINSVRNSLSLDMRKFYKSDINLFIQECIRYVNHDEFIKDILRGPQPDLLFMLQELKDITRVKLESKQIELLINKWEGVTKEYEGIISQVIYKNPASIVRKYLFTEHLFFQIKPQQDEAIQQNKNPISTSRP